MKSAKIVSVALFSIFYVTLNAQIFVGGSFSLSSSGGSTSNGTTTTDKPSAYSFELSPKGGMFLNEKLAVGTALDISFSGTKTPGNVVTTYKSSTVGLIPFVRYYAVTLDKFSVFGQGNIGLLFSNSTTKVGGTSTKGPVTARFYINIMPGLAYDLTDRLSLETSLNFLSLGYYNTTEKNGASKDKTTSFNIGAGLDNIVTVGNISIGAIYRF